MRSRVRRTLAAALCLILCAALAVTAAGCRGKTHQTTATTVTVDGKSMEPTLHDGETVVLQPPSGTPKTGDVVAFPWGGSTMIKRVIAVGGQALEIDFDHNKIYVDGVLLREDYIEGATVKGDIPEQDVNCVIPEGKVFVLGDSRTISLDSRHSQVGLIDTDDLIGTVQLPER